MNIKDYIDKELKNYVIGLNILLLVICFNKWFEKAEIEYIFQLEEIIFPILNSVIVSSFIGVFAFVFDALYSAEVKDAITMMKFFKRPGTKIFTKIKENSLKDDRIDNELARKVYKQIIDNIPKDDEKYAYENYKWYSIYNKYEKENKILVSQREYLLCRDLCVATVTEALLVLAGMIIGIIPWSLKIYILFGILYIITLVSTYNKADRFCRNVIAKDISKEIKN